ncbi:MAG: hypothetical protein ACK4TB_02650 [Gemmobacter sp.]
MTGGVQARARPGAEGSWTDHVEWTSRAHARAAPEAAMTQAKLVPFIEAIKAGTMCLRGQRS